MPVLRFEAEGKADPRGWSWAWAREAPVLLGSGWDEGAVPASTPAAVPTAPRVAGAAVLSPVLLSPVLEGWGLAEPGAGMLLTQQTITACDIALWLAGALCSCFSLL